MKHFMLFFLVSSAVGFTGISHAPATSFLFSSHNNGPSSISVVSSSRVRSSLTATPLVVNGDTSISSVVPNNIRLTVCEKARTVTSVCTSGTLCTTSQSEGIEGAPFGSFVDFVLDDSGNPVILMNAMSMHTMNIREASEQDRGRKMVTLFAQLAGQSGGQDVSRCSITGTIEQIPSSSEDIAQIRLRYSITHAYADQVMDSPKFAFYRLTPAKIYYVGGFGVQSQWVPVDEYQNARPDVLARYAADIVQKLNRDSEEDLTLVAVHLLETPNIEEIKVTSVDRLGMDVRVTNRVSRKKLTTNEYRIGFRIPVISVEDAKSEILKVFQEAWEKGQGYEWEMDDELPGSSVPVIKVAEDSLG